MTANRRGIPGVALVALAAALWGTDGVFRFWLAIEMPATLLVFLEHVILVVLTLPFLLRVGPVLKRLNAGDWVSVVLVGAGASVLGTVLFTMAFSYGDPNTPLLLQKLQPAFSVLAAALVLGERLTRHYWRYFVFGVAGAYLISFPDLTPTSVDEAAPALLALGAAFLWGLGTVLGRRLTEKVPFAQLAALRFAVGAPVAALAVVARGEWSQPGNRDGGGDLGSCRIGVGPRPPCHHGLLPRPWEHTCLGRHAGRAGIPRQCALPELGHPRTYSGCRAARRCVDPCCDDHGDGTGPVGLVGSARGESENGAI